MKKPELVSPAGDLSIAHAAFAHGADAVYVGLGRYNLRAHAPGLGFDDLIELLEFALASSRRVYVVCNTMPGDDDLPGITQQLAQLGEGRLRPDALVVSDPGVIRICQAVCPNIPLHLSTQTGTFNTAAMRFWHDIGIRRIVLPREFSLPEVRHTSDQGICQTEIFIHGAMCVSVSGRCLIGAYIDGRHANKGDCSQPCRLQYSVKPHNDAGEVMPAGFDVEEDGAGSSMFSSQDLCTLSILPQIVESGVSALKIEGRNKSIHYISSVVKVYRAALDVYCNDPAAYQLDPALQQELDLLDHRPYTTGFYTGQRRMQAVFENKIHSRVRMVGVVRELLGDKRFVVDVKNPFVVGESLDVLPTDAKRSAYRVIVEGVTDLQNHPVPRALTNRLVIMTAQEAFRVGDILRRIL